MEITTTSANNETIYWFTVDWKGHKVLMTAHEWPEPCPPGQHEIGVLHHNAEVDGKVVHFCPTGALWCYGCCAAGEEPGEPECTRWGT